MQINDVTNEIIGAAIEVHRALGPGLLESAYAACLDIEFRSRGLVFERENRLAIRYRDQLIENAYRLDFLVAGSVVVEVKSVEEITAVHEAQVISYLKLSGCPVGLLVNFNKRTLAEGIRRFANGLAG